MAAVSVPHLGAIILDSAVETCVLFTSRGYRGLFRMKSASTTSRSYLTVWLLSTTTRSFWATYTTNWSTIICRVRIPQSSGLDYDDDDEHEHEKRLGCGHVGT